MDTITHAISGAVIGAATALPGRERQGAGTIGQRALWGGLFAAFPDSDSITSLFMDHFDYLIAHRGLTHSVVMLPIWAALLGFIASRFGKLKFTDMALLAAMALVAHICGDLITSYGTRMFAPVWDAPLAWPIVFIIDPVFTLILLVGLMFSTWKQAVMPARVAGGVLLAYLALAAWNHNKAIEFGEHWAETEGISSPVVIAFPQPLSTFNWKVVVVTGETYHRSYINLLAEERFKAGEDAAWVSRVWSTYRPVGAAHWQAYPKFPPESVTRDLAIRAWQQEEFTGFRKFALLPYVSEVSGTSERVCVWFTDLRFTMPELDHPFEYAMCRTGPEQWERQLDREERD